MTKWQDITIEKPKEKKKYSQTPVVSYGDYGFETDFGSYSLHEENRDFRKHIQNEIVMEELKTQNILGNHISGETDRTIQEINDNTDTRATEIKQKIQEHNNYVVNTVYQKVQEIDNEVDGIKTTVEENKSVINQIWDRIRGWSW